ncbi:sugar ABC transporter ATP-binding protein [Sphaerochaeta sp.]|jgi:ABC-type sugar transport system ATPase subunit|uniref:sugar ABC transporter ATP-binding protein n=1 Tax=Sphaerochaeta sp. TaxID=1972642 RepID=UPI002A3596EF|nr:sugar ABC transporter ATP-binding protein [Sphaerochaeta sp.]MDX9985435.1 sugar ABC transporter ATP-binding protein [Sphaerochaeta sp.]
MNEKIQREVLRIEGLVKQYPGVRALKGVDLSFNSGEVHGLIGENGAGKSTLIKILAGIVKADEGTFYFEGEPATITSSKDASKHSLCFIHQELNLVNYFNAMENIFLGHSYPHRFGPLVDWKQLRAQAQEILDTLGIDLPLDIPVLHLSAVQRAMVAIARAFAVKGSIYFMDEPATALTDIEKEKLFAVVQNLKEQGKTVVYVTHNLEDILRITDRVTIMRDGQVVKHSATSEMTKDTLISAMIGKSLESAFPQRSGTIGKPLLEVEGLANSRLDDISFTVRSGEILGIGGLVGSGRTELLETLFGVRSLSSGSILLEGKPYHPNSPKEAIEQGVVLVPEERRKGGLVLNRSISENIALMSLSEVSRFGFLNHQKLHQSTEDAGKRVHLKASRYTHHVATLSGGNQQKVVFAKTVMRTPKVLMLDEPTKGVDVGARFEIYSIIRELASKGAAILVVSSDFNEVLGLADRILFIKDGSMASVQNNTGMDQEQYLHYCYGRTHA